MKIKYKLIIIFILIILSASLPLSLFILEKQEKEKIDLITHQGEINSRILARSTLNIILMNGGDVPSSRVDAKEMISILRPLTEDGLIYADSIILSSKEEYNGIVLASYFKKSNSIFSTDKIAESEVNRLKAHAGFKEIHIQGIDDICYEFISPGAIPGKPPFCIGRLIYSKSVILMPIKKLRRVIYSATGAAILLVGLLGLIFSRIISSPITELTQGVKKIEAGSLDYRVPVKSNDELGRLSMTFNQMLKMLELQVEGLRNANVELKRHDTLKDEFLANMSHELRSPLNAMIGLAESLISGAAGPLPAEAVHDLSLIETSGKRLSHLVNDILDFSKLKHHDIDLQLDPVDIYSVTQLVISIMMPLTKDKPLKIINAIEPENTVAADKNRLQQIMLNLLGNAIKFTEEGEILITAEKYSDDRLLIKVSDTGIGIPPDKQKRIFETFEQADGSVSRGYGGTGLGLAITKKLVELHRGEIWVESEELKGSVFCFTLGVSREKKKTETFAESRGIYRVPHISSNDIRMIPDTESPKKFQKEKILLVDDDPVNLQVLINHLSLEGFRIVTAALGSEALMILEKGELPDLLLLDVMLPRMSGYEVCRKVREQYSQHELPILMLTAKNKPGDVVTGLEAGANDYLTKPVDRQELLARVNGLISLKNSVKLNEELTLIKQELNIAHELQQKIIFKELPEFPRIGIAVRYKPMIQLGGDFYNIQKIDDDNIGILIADVSGHGISAALICSMLKVIYTFYQEENLAPDLLFHKINSAMYNYLEGQFITACYARIDLKEKKLHQANAGHWPLLICRDDDRNIIFERSYGLPFGWFPDGRYETQSLDLKEGDRIIFYTDGILEAMNPEGVMFEDENFHKLIKASKDIDAEGFADKALEKIRAWSELPADKSFDDDITLIVLDFIKQDIT